MIDKSKRHTVKMLVKVPTAYQRSKIRKVKVKHENK
jgi:hypothetical protein